MRSHELLSVVLALASASGCGAPATDRAELLTPPPAASPPLDLRATPSTAMATASAAATPTATASPGATRLPAGELDRELEDSDEFRRRREELVGLYIASDVGDPRVVEAMETVPRHSFVPTSQLDHAYGDFPLSIGYGQTISQPSLVARMTELLELEPGERVLEIGTGSGYQAAILAELTDEVYSVEIVPELAATARALLEELGYDEVVTDRRDGYLGWPEHAPYDAIIVTAAPDHLPQPLVEQLKEDGGRMVIPIGPVGDVQTLWLVTKENGEPQMERLLDVRFVPLTREDQ